jgi:hypothetical protein
MPSVVVAAYNVATFPDGGGHLWVYLQYLLALRQLGYEVYWLEGFRTKGRTEQEAMALATFRARMEREGLGDNLILYLTHSKEGSAEPPADYMNRSREEAEAIFERADLLLNFHYLISPGLLAKFRRTALIDIDPGLLQFWISRDQLRVPRHDIYFSTGETVGQHGSKIPDCGIDWIHMPPAVCLDRWPYQFDARCATFTTVSSWDSSDWIVDGNESYENTKRAAFLEFAELPSLTPQRLELALFLRWERDFADAKELERRGWRIRPSREVAAGPETYQAYIQQSRGEFSCAKRSCMKFQNAWVSDRTLCYLASGKPVVVQNTGASALLPNGEGMFRFSTLQEAADAIGAVNADYEHHCRAARKLAERHFDAYKVLREVLSRALSSGQKAVGHHASRSPIGADASLSEVPA